MGRLIRHLQSELEQNGIKDALKRTFRRGMDEILGVKDLKEEVKTLQYFLNMTQSVCDVPKASGGVRDLQLCDVQLMLIINRLCEKKDIKCWLDYGTLLGAVRHKGFIPWDDDADMAMFREDYNSFNNIVVEELGKFGIKIEEEKIMDHFQITYKHLLTGIKVDIFPVDRMNYPKHLDEDALSDINNRYEIYRKKYFRKRENKDIQSYLEDYKKRVFQGEGDNVICFHSPEFMYFRNVIHEYDDIFPLTTIEFEGEQFLCPGNMYKYLERIYGENYMSFPKSGIEHHAYKDVKMSDLAAHNNQDMTIIQKELRDILCQI